MNQPGVIRPYKNQAKREAKITAAEFRAMKPAPKPHKYRAEKCAIDGRTFASKAEARRYRELSLLAKAGQIFALQCQPRFVLHDAFFHAGKRIRAIVYYGDFSYQDMHGRRVVEDVKGLETPMFKLKYKLFLKRYPNIELRIVK
jgi:hypothetical protein